MGKFKLLWITNLSKDTKEKQCGIVPSHPGKIGLTQWKKSLNSNILDELVFTQQGSQTNPDEIRQVFDRQKYRD